MLSLYRIKQLLNPDVSSEPSDDFRIIQSWAEYDENSSKTPEERNLEYMCYELEVMNPSTGEITHFYKAIRFARVIRLPADAKQSTAFMDMQEQILAGVHEQGYNLITVIANVIKPVALGLLYLYGVQATSKNLEDAKRKAHYAFDGFIGMMQGTFRVLELRCANAQESEWLREKMYNMDYLTVVRGIPKANKAGEDAGNKGIGGSNLNPDSQGTLEEMITGMADYEYVIEVLSTPISYDTLRGWHEDSYKKMTDWNSQLSGTKSLSMNLSIPMMYMANAGQNSGWSNAFTDSNTVGYSQGESFSQSQGQSLSQSYGNTYGQTSGTSLSNSYSQGLTHSHGVSFGESFGDNQGFSQNFGTSAGQSWNQNQGLSQGVSANQGFGTSQGSSMGLSQNHNTGLSHNLGTSQNVGFSQGQSTTLGNTASVSNTATQSLSQTLGENFGNSYTDTYGNAVGGGGGLNRNFNMNGSDGYNWNDSYTRSHTKGNTLGAGINGGLKGETKLDKFGDVGWNLGGNVSGSHSKSNTYGSNNAFGQTHNRASGIGEGVNGSWNASRNASHSGGFNHGLNASMTNSSSLSHGITNSESMSLGQNYGMTQGYGSTEAYGTSQSDGIGKNWGVNSSQSNNYSLGNTAGLSNSLGQGYNVGNNASVGNSYGLSHSQNVSQSDSVSNSETLGQSIGQTYSQSVSQSATTGYGQNISTSNGNNYSTSNGRSQGSSMGTTGGTTMGTSASMGLGPSIGYSKSYQWKDQGVEDLLELMEYENERIKKALRGQGAFYTCVYIACPTMDALSTAQAVAKSTWQNEYAMTNPLQVLDLTESEQKHLLYHFSAFSADVSKEKVSGVEQYKYYTVLLPEEFVAYTHLPRISEGGVFATVLDIPKFSVPSMMHGEIYMGTILNPERYTFYNGYKTQFDYLIDESALMHGFFTGASRSGKTVAAMRFIAELSHVRRKKTGKRFRIVVLDPKQDWRALAMYIEPERFNFYSMGNPKFRPIHINPWKVPYGVQPQIWIDGLIDIYCRSYGLLERGKQMIADVVYGLYEEAGVFEAADQEDWMEDVHEKSGQVCFAKIYKRMEEKKVQLENPNNKTGRAGNDTRDAYARLLERLSCFNREFSIEYQLYGQPDGIAIDELIGQDDVTVLESKGLENTFKNFIFGAVTSGFYKYAIAHEGGFKAPDQFETVLVIEEANEVLIGNDTSSGGDNMSLSGESEFEQILDQSAGYGLFIMAITQKIADMPSSIIANTGLVFAGRLVRPDDISTVIRAIGREERIDDRDLVKWFPRAPTGWFVCKTSRNFDFKDSEPILVQIAQLDVHAPKNYELNELLIKKEMKRTLAAS